MLQVTVPVVRTFEHEGRTVSEGDTITVAPATASALSLRGLVSLSREYRRRDAEAAPASAPDAPDPVAPARTKRRYRRRDLTAEV